MSLSIPHAALTIDGDLSDWPASAEWSAPFVFWDGAGLSSTTKAKFAWNDAEDLLYVAVQTNEAIWQPGGHLVIGPTTNITSIPDNATTGSTQLCFDTQGGNDVLIQNEIQYYVDNFHSPYVGGGIDGVQAKYSYDSGTGLYTYEIALPLWTNWLEMTTKQPLSPDTVAYVYVVMQDYLGGDNGMDLSYNGNPEFYKGASASPNAWIRAAALVLLAPTTADLTAVLAAMDTRTGQPGYTVTADMDLDGEVTSSDLAIVLADLP
jgi:hypothetical protein